MVEVDSVLAEIPSMSCRARSGHMAREPSQDWRRTMRSLVTSGIVAHPQGMAGAWHGNPGGVPRGHGRAWGVQSRRGRIYEVQARGVLVGFLAHQRRVQFPYFMHEFAVPKGRIVGVISDYLEHILGQFIEPNYRFSYTCFAHEYFGF